MKLSNRLKTVSDVIKSLGNQKTMADIGSDHGLLPAYVIKNGICEEVFASDVAKGPYDALLHTIAKYDLGDRVIPCFGNGLEPLLKYDKHYDIICICGMGAKVMVDILKSTIHQISFGYLILQSNIDENDVREYLFSNGFCIVEEKIVHDASRYYEIIVAKFGEQQCNDKEKDILFGPILRNEKNRIFIKKWKRELLIQENILSSLAIEHPKHTVIRHKIELIKEILEEN